jgi:excisionase family DNA binding protein
VVVTFGPGLNAAPLAVMPWLPRSPAAHRGRPDEKGGDDLTTEDPAVLTVEEAAQVLRIGRSAAYEQARRFIATGGAEGLPAVRLGRCLRVPRQALVRLLAVGDGAPDADG